MVSKLVIWFSALSSSCSRYRFFLSSSLARLQREHAVTQGRPSPCSPSGPAAPPAHSLLLAVPQELPGDAPLALQLLRDPLLVLLQLVPLLLQLLREQALH